MKYLRKKVVMKLILTVAVSTSVTACLHDDQNAEATPSDHYAVITTQASDFSSGDISIISLEDYSADNTNFAGGSDSVISTHEGDIYRIGRYQQDNITKLSINAPETAIWQYSANGEGEETTNPYKLVVKNSTTAYLIRYGHAKVWIVDPSAESFEAFKTGEINLSGYATDDNIPEVADALLIDNKLYLLMQNLDRTPVYPWAMGQAYVAVIDTADNSEIDTNSDSTTPKGIALKVVNPQNMEYLSSNNTIYIAGVGPYSSPDYSGGVEALKLNDYSSKIVVDDGDINNHPYGQITKVAILNETRGYFVGYSAYKDTAVYSFNPDTMEVDATPLVSNMDISDIEIGPLGNLWITNRGESGITIYDTVDNTVLKELIDTDLVPSDIEFVSVKEIN